MTSSQKMKMKDITSFNYHVSSMSMLLFPILLMCLDLTTPVQSDDDVAYLLNANELMALAQHGYGHYHHPPPKPKKHHHSHHYDKGGYDHG